MPYLNRLYFRYWGKASPFEDDTDRFHLLPFLSLDVAACGQELVQLPQFSLAPLAEEQGWPVST